MHPALRSTLRLAGARYWTASMLPALVGTTLPFWLRPPGFSFRWLGAVEFLIATVLMHAGFSFLLTRVGRRTTGEWPDGRLISAAVGCMLAASLLGLHISTQTTPMIFIVYGLTTIFAGLLYVVPPFSLHERIGGEIVVSYSLGMLPVLGAYLVQTGDLTRTVYLASLPIVAATGLWVWTGLMASRTEDERAGRGSLVIAFGPVFAGRVGVPAISLVICAAVAVAALSSSLAPWALLGLLPAALALRVVAASWSSHSDASRMLAASGIAAHVHLWLCAILVVSSLVPRLG